jgi:LysR family glycine cleavage system transcriptional activator
LNLPPLKALRAFEAAGRHLSLSKAADELFVSPGAISQQIKLLEQYLSTRLFERQHRKVTLTAAGEKLLPGVSTAFDQIMVSVAGVKQLEQNRPLTVSVAPSFASRWLVPRLRDFNQKHPDIDVRIDTSTALADLAHSDIDAGIRFGSGHYPGLNIDFLICQEVFPVCSPALLDARHPLITPSDLGHYQLLHYEFPFEDSSWPDWQMWLAAAGMDDLDFSRGLRFLEVNLLIDAAIQGQGVALAGSISVNDAIDAGHLIKPFDLTIPQDFAYYFVTHPTKAPEPKVQAFREWILEQISSSSAR